VASKSHAGRYCFATLTAILQSEKLIPPRSGEVLTLRVSPRGFLKRQRGATFGPPLPLYDYDLPAVFVTKVWNLPGAMSLAHTGLSTRNLRFPGNRLQGHKHKKRLPALR
jgi:hypothetical protein